MMYSKIAAGLLASVIAVSGASHFSTFSLSTAAADTCTVTFYDFDKKPFKTMILNKGQEIDYSQIDTSLLRRHVDVYTEQKFSAWNISPKTVTADTNIYALSTTAVISIDSMPDKIYYKYKQGSVMLDGLKVFITINTQKPLNDGSGGYNTVVNTVDISSSCAAQPSELSAAFAEKRSADITIYPIGDNKPVATYTIRCLEGLGDVNKNGRTDAVDASRILSVYADLSAGDTSTLTEEFLNNGDVNFDGAVNSKDSTLVLQYYAIASSHEVPDWEKLLAGDFS